MRPQKPPSLTVSISGKLRPREERRAFFLKVSHTILILYVHHVALISNNTLKQDWYHPDLIDEKTEVQAD